MSSGITVKVFDRTPALLRALEEKLGRDALNIIIARAGEQKVRDHLFEFGRSHPNQMHGRRTDFYGTAAKSTHGVVDQDGAKVAISKLGIAQRFFGGPIAPVNRKFLTFAVNSKSYGRSSLEMPDLNLIINSQKTGGIKYEGPRPKKGERVGEDRIMFAMTTKTIQQKGDRDVLPSQAELKKSIVGELKDYVSTLELRK